MFMSTSSINQNPYDFALQRYNVPDYRLDPSLHQTFTNPVHNASLTKVLQKMNRACFANVLGIEPYPSSSRATDVDEQYRRLGAYLTPWFARDGLSQFAFGITVEQFNDAYEDTAARLEARAKAVLSMIGAGPPPTDRQQKKK